MVKVQNKVTDVLQMIFCGEQMTVQTADTHTSSLGQRCMQLGSRHHDTMLSMARLEHMHVEAHTTQCPSTDI